MWKRFQVVLARPRLGNRERSLMRMQVWCCRVVRDSYDNVSKKNLKGGGAFHMRQQSFLVVIHDPYSRKNFSFAAAASVGSTFPVVGSVPSSRRNSMI